MINHTYVDAFFKLVDACAEKRYGDVPFYETPLMTGSPEDYRWHVEEIQKAESEMRSVQPKSEDFNETFSYIETVISNGMDYNLKNDVVRLEEAAQLLFEEKKNIIKQYIKKDKVLI